MSALCSGSVAQMTQRKRIRIDLHETLKFGDGIDYCCHLVSGVSNMLTNHGLTNRVRLREYFIYWMDRDQRR